MAQFILFIRGGNEAYEGFTPEQIQQAIERYRQWARSLEAQGKLVDAFKLKDDGGRRVEVRQGQRVVDGPFAETKETIGGYYLINAADYAEACEIARECPALDEGGTVEVREIEG
jgi:hypothetical protein